MISIRTSDNKIASQYFFNTTQSIEGSEGDIFHSKSIKLIEVLRLAYPDREAYETKAIGHRFSFLESNHDSTVKNIPAKMLPHEELVEVNSTFINLVNFNFRPRSWKQFASKIIERRQFYVEVLTKQVSAFISYHKGRNLNSLVEYVNNFSEQYNAKVRGNPTIQLPQTIVDEWGSGSETSSKQKGKPKENDRNTKYAIALKHYEGFSDKYKEFDTAVKNYLWQSTTVIYNRLKGELKEPLENSDQMGRISLVGNLFPAYAELFEFQQQFRKYFSKFDTGILVELDNKEIELLSSLCFIYRHYLYRTTFLSGNVHKNSLAHLTETKRDLEIALNKNLQKLAKELHFEIRILFQNAESECFIFMTASSPLECAKLVEPIYNEIHQSINKPDFTSIKYAILNAHYQSFKIIPLVAGKMVTAKWYDFKLYNLIEKPYIDLAQFNLIPQEIPKEFILKHRLGIWSKNLVQFESLEKFLAAVSTCHQLGFHILQFHKLNDEDFNDEDGRTNLRSYLQATVNIFQENLQLGMDMYNHFASACHDNSYDFESEDERADIYNFLVDNHKYFYPTDESYEKRGEASEVSTLMMEQWIPRLETLTSSVSVAYLFLAGKIISKSLTK